MGNRIGERANISGLSTEAKQDTMITALQLIDDLRNALGSVNTDDLQVDVKSQTVNRQVTTAINAVTFDNVTTTYTSATIDLNAYRDFLLELNVDVTAAPTDLLIDVLMSDDDVTYYKYQSGAFGDLRYEDTAGDLLEAIEGPVIARYMKIRATAAGTTAVNMFTLTAKVVARD